MNDEGGLRLWEGAWVNEEGGLLLWEPTREYKEQGVGVRLWEATGSRLPPRMPGGGRGVRTSVTKCHIGEGGHKGLK